MRSVPRLAQCLLQLNQCLDEAGLEPERVSEVLDGLLEPPLAVAQCSQALAHSHVLGIERQDLLPVSHAVLASAHPV